MIQKILASSPFSDSKSSPSVFLTSGDGPYINTRKGLSNINLSCAHGKRILLKPNAGRMAPKGSGIITHPEVIAAAMDAFIEAGAEVAVGESPILGVKAKEAFDLIGITAIAKERNCRIIDMDERSFVEAGIRNGVALKSIKVCPDIFEYDYVVSIPVMKMHMHTGVTLSVKNMKGCLWRRSKVELHMLPPVEGHRDKPIDIAIADMSFVLRPQLSIIDGTVGMEGMGPSAGQPKYLDIIIISADPFAADSVACQIMGTCAERIPHLRIASERGYGVTDLKSIHVIPENWREFINPFTLPPANLAISFPNINIMDKNSCSACQSTLLLFLKRYADRLFDYFPKDSIIKIAIGKGHKNIPDGTICIGNCTAKHRGKGIFIPGCPPVGSQILTAITGIESVDLEDGGYSKKDS